MKVNLIKFICFSTMLAFSGLHCFSQDFVNLDFDSANVAGYPPNSMIPAIDAFPGWQTSGQVWYDAISIGGALTAILDANALQAQLVCLKGLRWFDSRAHLPQQPLRHAVGQRQQSQQRLVRSRCVSKRARTVGGFLDVRISANNTSVDYREAAEWRNDQENNQIAKTKESNTCQANDKVDHQASIGTSQNGESSTAIRIIASAFTPYP